MKPKQIKELRGHLGITQRELAIIIGCTVYSVEHYEQGVRIPTSPFDERLEKLLKRAKKLDKDGQAR